MPTDAPLYWTVARRAAADGPPDPALVARYLAGDREAFALLVSRHGPMVLGVCRRVLGPGPDADDAFQAAFVVLHRRAGRLRDPARLGNWLYGVAHRCSLAARTARRRRLRREVPVHPLPEVPARPESPADGAAVERELGRLPERYRAAVALCLVDGRSRADAARLLGIPEGTLSSRLAEGRRRLAARLGAAGLAAGAAPAAVPAALQAAAVTATAGGTGSGPSLATGVIAAMTRTTRMVWAAGLVAVGLGAASVVGPADAAPAAPAAAVAAADNLLKNGGAEAGGKTPDHWEQGADIDGVEYLWDRKAGKAGKASLCIKKTAKKYFPIAQWQQTVDRPGDAKAVKLTAQVKADGVTKAVLDVLFLDDKGEWVEHKWAAYIGPKEAGGEPFTHDWKEYTGRVPVPAGARKVQVGLQVYGPGTVWFDEVRLEAAE